MPYKDPEKRREYKRLWRQANPDKVREQNWRYREANLDRERERSRLWNAANRDKMREYSRRRSIKLSLIRRSLQALGHKTSARICAAEIAALREIAWEKFGLNLDDYLNQLIKESENESS